jgi:hypothetical protein
VEKLNTVNVAAADPQNTDSGQDTRKCTVKNLRTPCCTQVTKTKDSYLYQKSSSAETRWRAVDEVTARDNNVLATEYGWDDLFSG